MSVVALLVCTVFVAAANAAQADVEEKLRAECGEHSASCSECINFNSLCAWCSDENFDRPRCDLGPYLHGSCKRVKTGKRSQLIVQQDDAFQDITDRVSRAVQIRPQKVLLQLRPGDTETITLKYRVAKNYPLDLYYLLDATYTMRDDIETIVNLGDELSQSLQHLTRYVRVGFGRFSDKVAMPFARMDPESLRNPCKGAEEGACSAAFHFRHDLSMNSDIKEFIEKMNSTVVTANLDNAEGALDALLQVVVCNEHIGWKHDSRKLVIVLTNGVLHFAGDGKLAGASKMPDGLCHLDADGFYTESHLRDYPSLSQIYNKLKKHKINVIFAVTEDVIGYYKRLNAVIPDFSYVTLLHADSSNILNVIRQGYEEALATVTFQDDSRPPVRVAYYSHCKHRSQELNKTSSCYGVEKGRVYEFLVQIGFDKCPEDRRSWNQNIVIDEKLIDTESLEIELEMLCGCECPRLANTRPRCSNHGELRCGVCECDDGWSGDTCDCDIGSFQSSWDSENRCRITTNDSISMMCSGRGECVCGKCICESHYSGKYCECKPCRTVNGQQCGGPKHGWCACGECECQPEYTGGECQCPVSNSSCVAPGDEQLCSGNGRCQCGKCKCDTDNFAYSGDYCETCSICGGLCGLYDQCVRCTILDNCKGSECASRSVNHLKFVDKLQDGSSSACKVYAEREACVHWSYSYEINRNHTVNIEVLAADCRPIQMGQYALYVFLAVLFPGLLAIAVYKFRVERLNRREFVRYKKFLEMTTYNKEDNPLYVSPKTYYEVPTMKD